MSLLEAIKDAAKGLFRPSHDPVVDYPQNDILMGMAVASARETLPYFWTRFESDDPTLGEFAVKVGIEDSRGGVEHIWMEIAERRNDQVRGRLSNQPRALQGLGQGDEIWVEIAKISDWLYQKDGLIYGAYTQRAMLAFADERARREAEMLLSPEPTETDKA